MEKRNYTHVQVLLPEIKAMLAEGKTQREVAEHYGFKNKQVVKSCLSVSGEKNGSWRPESFRGPKDDRGKMPHQETLWQSRRMRSGACRWRTNCCGIFCGPQEGSESKGKIPHHISSQRGISNIRHVRIFAVSRSGYYAFVHRLDRPEKDAALAEIIAQQRERSFRTYGYRRMWLWLRSQNIFRDPKTVLRIMKKYALLSEIRRRRKWQQMGQQVHRYENLLNREFHADRPNSKWVTDISYIHTKQGILYLSMIRDLYDNSIVAYKTGTQQTVNLVLDTIRLAMKQQKRQSLRSCSSTATRDFSTPREHTST